MPVLGHVQWEPNAPNESFAHDQDVGVAALVLRAHPNDPDQSSVTILWSQVETAAFGPPSKEDRRNHPLYDAGLDKLLWAGEVLGLDGRSTGIRHFLIPTKGGMAEVRARQINVARLRPGVDAKTAIRILRPGSSPSEPRYPEASVNGFTIGMFVSYGDCGDAWVTAPDGGTATLIWESGQPAYFRESIPPDPAGRWGTYTVQLNLPMTTDEQAAEYLRALLPELTPRWAAWARSR